MNEITADTQIVYGGAIKTLGNGRVGGRLVAFTGPQRRDLSGEYFDRETDFGDTPDTGARVMYHHALDKTVGAAKLGVVDVVKFDDEGIWIEAQLDLNHHYAQRVQKLVERGALSWSSGALPQTARVDKNGHIRTWHIFEASLTPTPAEPFATRIMPIKSLADAPTLESLLAKEAADDADENADAHVPPSHTKSAKEIAMSMKNSAAIIEAVRTQFPEVTAEQIAAIIAAVEGSADAAIVDEAPADALMTDMYDEAKATPVQKAAARIAEHVAAKFRLAGKQNAAKAFSGYARHAATDLYANGVKAQAAQSGNGENMTAKAAPWASNGAPAVVENLAAKARWSNYSTRELSAIASVLAMCNHAAKSAGAPVISLDGLGALYQVASAHALEESNSRKLVLSYQEAQKAAAIKAMKSDELDNTAQADYGAEFVHTLWQNQLVEDARRDNVVAPLIDSFQMNAKIVTEPVQGGRGTVYYAPEATADTHQAVATSTIPDSKVGTDNRTFTAGKLATRIGWSAELEEDSIIRFSQYVLKCATENLARSIDHVILMGDNATSGNINYDGGTPTATNEYMIFDGIGLHALANGVDGGGTGITYAQFLATRYKLNREASGRLSDIVFFIPPEMEHYILAMPEVVTLDKFGPEAPVLTGQVGRLGGIPVVVTPVIQLADADGKITYNGNVVSRSRGIMVYRPGWKVGYRRSPEPYMYRAPDGESWQLTLTTRMDLQNSQQTLLASMLYNSLA